MREKFEPRLKIEYGEKKEKENKETEMIEKLPLDYQSRKDLALAYLDEKPASWIDVSERYKKTEKNEDEILNKLKLRKDTIQKILDKAGFIYELEEFKTEERTTYNTGYNFIIAKNSENLSRIKKALKEGNEKEKGLLFGYPKTAVEGFINRKVLDYNELPKKESKRLIKEKTSKFLDFRLSKNNWFEELKIVRKQQKLIKEKFPNLYQKITKYGLDRIIERKLDLIEKLKKPSNQLKNLLNLIDENVFPENTLPVEMVKRIESKYDGKIPIAEHYFDEDENGEMANECYRINREIDKEDYGFKEDYEFIDLKGIAIHEIRHRIQHTLKPELFNKENIKGFKEKYPALTLLIDRFPKELSPEDFDACLVENLSLFLIKNWASLSEILENIISKNPEEIFENIEKLAKEHNFEIPSSKIKEDKLK